MLPFSDFFILQEIKRTRPSLWEQMMQGNPAAEGPEVAGGPDQMPQPPEQKPDEEEPEETDSSEEEDEDEGDDRKTDLKMIHNCIKQVKTPELKNILRQFLDKLKDTSPSEPASQMEEPPAAQVPDGEEGPPPPEGPDPNAVPGPTPAQGGGGM